MYINCTLNTIPRKQLKAIPTPNIFLDPKFPLHAAVTVWKSLPCGTYKLTWLRVMCERQNDIVESYLVGSCPPDKQGVEWVTAKLLTLPM